MCTVLNSVKQIIINVQSVNARAPPIHRLSYHDACGRTGWLNDTATITNTTERKERQLLDTLGDLWSRLWSSSDYDNEEVTEDIALSDFAEWPWQVSFMLWREGL